MIEAINAEHKTGFRTSTPPPDRGTPHPGAHLTATGLPDLTDEENIARLDRWDGSWAYLPTLAWVTVTKAGLIKPAEFHS